NIVQKGTGNDGYSATGPDPLLAAGLADNGGPTQTLALQPGSPAIGAGAVVPGITTDQRGLPRGSAPDLGAVNDPSAFLAVNALVEGPAAGSDADLVTHAGAWSATANASWLHVSSGGTGNQPATFSFDANPGATRTGTLTIAGETLTVTQA